MRTSLAYINTAFGAAVAREAENPTLPEAVRKEATAKAIRSITGFHVLDPVKERKLLDERLESRRTLAKTFQQDREKAEAKLSELGIKALAFVPIAAWNDICQISNLYRLDADKDGTVGYDACWIERYRTAAAAENAFKKDWASFVALMFPAKVSMPSHHRVTLMMPKPPADVISILLKAQDLPLQVASVADAIQFKETIPEIWRRTRTKIDEEARYKAWLERERWLKYDPIIYWIFGTVVAIIAQFGDFPVERYVVDTVVGTEYLTPPAKPVVPQAPQPQYVQYPNGVMSYGQLLLGGAATTTQNTFIHPVYNSGAWTGAGGGGWSNT